MSHTDAPQCSLQTRKYVGRCSLLASCQDFMAPQTIRCPHTSHAHTCSSGTHCKRALSSPVWHHSNCRALKSNLSSEKTQTLIRINSDEQRFITPLARRLSDRSMRWTWQSCPRLLCEYKASKCYTLKFKEGISTSITLTFADRKSSKSSKLICGWCLLFSPP